jgi:hypothetical protein
MRLSPCHTVSLVHGCRVLPLTRAWHELVHGLHGAIPLRRPVGGYGDVARPQTVTLASASAIVTPMAIEPQYVFGAARVGGHLRSEIT